jgi:hypothetical protein
MIAFARLASVPCQRLAPDADSFHALALRRLIKPPITEKSFDDAPQFEIFTY